MSASVPFAVHHIDHIVLRVQDLERSIAFYGAVLGCTVERRRPELGLMHLRAGTSMIDLISIDGTLGSKGGAAPGEQGRNVDHLCLRIDPFSADDILRHLHAHGLAHDAQVQNNFGAEGVGPSIYFADPDANLIELKGPPA